MTTIPTGKCMLCGQDSEVEVDDENAGNVIAYMVARRKGLPQGLIQNELPFLTAAQRELILTGSHDECFNNAFPDE